MSSPVQPRLFTERINIRSPFSHVDGNRDLSQQPGLADIIGIASSNAPYLARLIDAWPEILKRLETETPEKISKSLYENFDTGQSLDDLKMLLRHRKQQIHLLTALCDIGGAWDWAQVTENLTAYTDNAMRALIDVIACEMGFHANECGPVPGLFVLALGKYGARELNYSSDIDLIVFYDPDRLHLPDHKDPQRTLVRFVRTLMRGFDDITPEGYVFRTDLRLRPDPRANTVAVSTVTAERYYETLGQNWERAAMIKARYCGGDEQAAREFLDYVVTPYIWRKNLDYAAIADIHSIKRQIQADATPEQLRPEGHDLKLGIGGIREIEFFAQVQQLILGGRQKSLRVGRTVEAIGKMSEQGYIKPETADRLCKDYAVLRDLEHRAQMYADEQTHLWPSDAEKRKQLAALCHVENVRGFEQKMCDLFLRVHATYSALFPDEEDLSSAKGSLVFTGVEPEAPTLETLQAYGFERAPEVWRHMADWLGGRIRATRTPRARELLTRLAPRIIESCGTTNIPDTAFFNFAEFITELNAGVTLLSMFVNKPMSLAALIDMLSLAPVLAKMLSGQPALIDAMIEPDFLVHNTADDPDYYASLIDELTDFETALNLVRRAVHEDQFSLMASLLKLQNVAGAGKEFSGLATAAISALLPMARKETERLYGQIKGDFAIIGMGKLGGGELSLSSDLDLILVYRPAANETDESIYNKLTRRIITALSSVTEEGGLYEVDMALRPSGRSGPLAVRLDAFQKYYQENAWTWEFMALSRARAVASSSPEFSKLINSNINSFVIKKDFQGNLEADILDMHARLGRDKPAKGDWDIKGRRGGLRDIEFIAQYLVLKNKPENWGRSTLEMLQMARAKQWVSAGAVTKLITACQFYHELTELIAVTMGSVDNSVAMPGSVKTLLTTNAGLKSFEQLELELGSHCETVRDIFSQTIKTAS